MARGGVPSAEAKGGGVTRYARPQAAPGSGTRTNVRAEALKTDVTTPVSKEHVTTAGSAGREGTVRRRRGRLPPSQSRAPPSLQL